MTYNNLRNYNVHATQYMYRKYPLPPPPEYQIAIAIQPVVLQFQGILRQVSLMTPNHLEHQEVKGTTYMFY